MKKRRRYRVDLERCFSHDTVLLTAAGTAINVVLSGLVTHLGLPLYLDNVGSVLVGVLGGVVPGMVAAFTSNYLWYLGDPSGIMFGVLTVVMAALAAEMSKRGAFRIWQGYVLLWVLMVAIGGGVGSVMGWYLYGEVVGKTISAPCVFWLCDHGLGGFSAQFLGDLFLDMIDKAITVLLMALVLCCFPKVLRGRLPLGYLYRCSSKELAEEYAKRRVPYAGISVFNKIMYIILSALVLLSVMVTWYSTLEYLTHDFLEDGDLFALFSFVVQLLGLEFSVSIFAIILSSWMSYTMLIQPTDAIMRHTLAFQSADQETWLESEAWKQRYVVRTRDEIQVLYDAICSSEESIAQKVASLRENETRLRHLSETDLMTGLKNRGTGESAINALLRAGMPGLFCIMDCDKFKAINDTYGHMAGDAALVAVARAMEAVSSPEDVLMRMGGDEFIMYLPRILTEEEAQKFFTKFFRWLAEHPVAELKQNSIFLSLGAVFCRGEPDLTFDKICRQADSALYESKKTKGFSAHIFPA
ncbi:MAG: diguanylate cyclase [Bacillota bacterium]|nr:diguanylate cyclase [Bacillota bacterium]